MNDIFHDMNEITFMNINDHRAFIFICLCEANMLIFLPFINMSSYM
jgi:hypothetical protein